MVQQQLNVLHVSLNSLKCGNLIQKPKYSCTIYALYILTYIKEKNKRTAVYLWVIHTEIIFVWNFASHNVILQKIKYQCPSKIYL